MSPSVFSSTNRGTISTCSGIIIVARYTAKTTPRPRTGSRLNTYAAVELVNSCTRGVAPAMTTTYRMTLPAMPRAGALRRAVSAIGHPLALADDLHDRHAQHDGEQHPAEGGCLTGGAVAEREVVDLLHDHLRRSAGAAA